jgi:hypothetical protein
MQQEMCATKLHHFQEGMKVIAFFHTEGRMAYQQIVKFGCEDSLFVGE